MSIAISPRAATPLCLVQTCLVPSQRRGAEAKHDAWNLHEDNIFDIFMRLALRWETSPFFCGSVRLVPMGYPKSYHLFQWDFSIINHPFWGSPIDGNL